MDHLKEVIIYTDGACIGNPGPGGYGVVLLYGPHRKELSGGFCLTTNNRMEILAAIAGLAALKEKCNVTLYSDSQYLVNGIQKGWAKKWQENNWWRTKSEGARNIDLWERLLDLCAQHKVAFVWVKGHAGNAENERCDRLSSEAAAGSNLLFDEFFESPKEPRPRIRVTEEGQPCKKCSTPVVKKLAKNKKSYYFLCPSCRTTYSSDDLMLAQASDQGFASGPSLFDLSPNEEAPSG